jgi:CMP-N-acetylneuraminic acid synthetase
MNPTLAIVPARAGSRGIPHKNRALVGGRPLIAWTIAAAQASVRIDRVIVSTDCPEIADLSKNLGADVPFLRPPELAQDDTPGIAPILDALERLAMPGAPAPGWIVQLQPTSPLRTAVDIDAALSLAETCGTDSVVSIVESTQHPHWAQQIDAQGRLRPFIHATAPLRRQELPPAYSLNGAVSAASLEVLRERASFLGPGTAAYVMPIERSVDVDAPFDLDLADWLLRRRYAERASNRSTTAEDVDDASEIGFAETGRRREADHLVVKTFGDPTAHRR